LDHHNDALTFDELKSNIATTFKKSRVPARAYHGVLKRGEPAEVGGPAPGLD